MGIPGQIKIGEYSYTFKDTMKSDVKSFIYRCQKWDCKISIHINRENIAKIIVKNNKEQIKYIQIYKKKNINVNY